MDRIFEIWFLFLVKIKIKVYIKGNNIGNIIKLFIIFIIF